MWSVFFYIGSILLANWMVHTFGIIETKYIMFPAGAVAIGLTFSARDFVQRRYGKWKCWIWMGLAGVITAAINPKLAMASIAAFLCAETIDWCLFTFTNYSFKKRIMLSNVISTPIDSLVFVTVAFGFFWPAVWGQALVKFASSLIPLLFIKDTKEEDELFTPEMRAVDNATLAVALGDKDGCCGDPDCGCKSDT